MKAIDRRGIEPVEVTYRAPIVISNVGAPITYQRLLPTDGEIGRRTAKARAFIDALKGGMSAVTLYLRLKAPVSTLGIKGENYWINATLDHDDVEADTAMVLAGEPRHVYLSFPSAKSGDDRFHTAEIITMLHPDAFDAWRGSVSGDRGRDYAELKATRCARPLAPRRHGGAGLFRAGAIQRTVNAADRRALHLAPGGPLLRPAGKSGAISILAACRAHADCRASISAAPTWRASASWAP